MTCVAHAREIDPREARISWLEAEIQRQGNIIAAQADRIASRCSYPCGICQVCSVARQREFDAARRKTPKPVHPSKIKTLPLSIGILEGHGGSER